MLAAAGSSLSSKRLSLTQVVINLIGVTLFFPFIGNFTSLLTWTSADLPRQIANAHTIFNITVTIVMLPLVSVLVSIVTKLLPGQEIRLKRGTEFIDEKLLTAPSIALAQAEKEVHRMGDLTYEMLEKSIEALQEDKKQAIAKVTELEDIVDEIYHATDKFLDDPRFMNLNENESKKLAYLKHSVAVIERVGDHANNLAELAQRKLKKDLYFSKDAKKELFTMFSKTREIYEKTLVTLKGENKELVQEIQELEDEITRYRKVFEANHIRRMENKVCDPLVGIIFVDILRNLERIANHSSNIANSTLLGF
jgi:phosphate:Na+ symporter